MSLIHTKFIIHWLGKDFHETPCDAISLDTGLRQKYVDGLISVLNSGLYMKKDKEEILGQDGRKLPQQISRCCFTEIKLSLVEQHTKRYGLLGIGFDREFVLNRFGNPVFYLKSGGSNIAVNARKVLTYLEALGKEGSQNTIDCLEEYRTMLGYFKNMNENDNENKLINYDELEWRITHCRLLETDGKVQTINEEEYLYSLKLEPNDIKVLVFPDEQTKELAFNNKDFQDKMNNPAKLPIIMTLDDCKHF